ncbi:MAG: iron ABC transporter permease [Alphaproteobacteria bacterium]|nr:iron ABC transporter permease [Alphaproteobacteria bacterium]
MRTTLDGLELPPKRRFGLWFLPDRWSLLALVLALVVALPVLVVFASLLVPHGDVWRHLASTVLLGYVGHTLALAAGVAVGVTLIGVGNAWLVTMCQFPGRNLFEWALLLPFAVPTYIIGYTYTDLLQYAGPVQTALRETMGWSRQDYWFPEIRSLGGAIMVMTLVLYPYVYLLSRAAFLSQSSCLLDVSRTLGRNPWRHFVEVAVPMARPAIVGGVALALMETMADFGTVQYFGISTFTTGIYRTWFALGEPMAAAQLAAVLMIFVLSMLWIERTSRQRARYDHTTAMRPLTCYHLPAGRGLLALLACLIPIALGFLLPTLALMRMAWRQGDWLMAGKFLPLAWNSFTLATLAAALTVGFAVLVTYGVRLRPNLPMKAAASVAGLGYAIPGTVIAVGVLIPFARLDNLLNGWLEAHVGISTGLLLSGTIFGLLFAYIVRFLAVALNSVEAGFGKINRHLDDAARSLGHRPGGTLLRVHLPLLRGALLTAVVIVFVDVLKELPATLIMRPFNFETLAVRVYQFASDERLAEASTAALAIVAVGLLPVILLSRAIAQSRPRSED